MIRRYLTGIIAGTGDLLGLFHAEPECWWGGAAGGGSAGPFHTT